MPAERLLDDVWGGEQSPERNRLQVHVSRLRRTLGDDRIVTRGGGYALEMPDDGLDANRFESLVASGRNALEAGDAWNASRVLSDGLGLWRGSVLAEFADSEFARPVITQLEESRLATLEDRIQADLVLGRHGELVGELEALVQEHPLREGLWAQLITALYRAGRQGDALRAFQRARRELADELGIDPGPALKALEAAVLSQDPSLAVPSAPQPQADRRPGRVDNLPLAPGLLIGRTADLASVASALQAGRIVTVVGAGGVGKTRLAIEVGRSLLDGYPDGVWLVDLAAVADATAVSAAFNLTMRVEPESGPGATTSARERLAEFLNDRQVLLVVDNCEHVVGEVAGIAEFLLARCEGLRILATSRERLSVAGESLWPLEPLPLDDAVTLFLARARAVVPGLAADQPTMTTAATICARLDGLPLAIELAAARLRAFTANDILARLDDRFRLLTGGSRTALPRQQTLRAVVDWSYDLLFDEERRVFEAVSIFASEFTVHAAEQICADDSISPDDIADVVARLVDKSLLTAVQTEAGSRFRLLQTLADYGRDRLVASGDHAAVCARHARWVMSFVEVPDAAHGSAGQNWFATINRSLDDIRQAMEWTLESADPDTALAIAGGLGWFWNMGGRIDDCWRWLTAALALSPAATPRRVRALTWAGTVGVSRDRGRALTCGAEAVELARILDDRPALALAAVMHGSVLTGFFDQRARSVELLEEAHRAYELEGDDWSRATADLTGGLSALAQGDPDRAWPFLHTAANRFRGQGNPWAAATALQHLADIDIWRGRYDDAISALDQALSGLGAVGATGISGALSVRVGTLCAMQNRFEETDRWYAQALAAAEKQRDVPLLALVHNAQGESLRLRNRLDEAESHHRLALALFQQRSVAVGLAFTHASLGYLSELRNDAGTAERDHRASLDHACQAADRRAQARALEGLAGVASLNHDPDATGRLLGAASALRDVATLLGGAVDLHQVTGGPLPSTERIDVDRAIARLEDRDALNAAFAEGQSDPEAVIAQTRRGNLLNH